MRRCILLALALLAVTSKVDAYVRTRTSSGTPVLWNGACASLALGADENPAYPAPRLRAALAAVIGDWEAQLSGCAALDVTVAEEPTTVSDVARDGTSLVRWRFPGACADPARADSELCTIPDAAAITTVFFIDDPGGSRDGEILEVDLELNAMTFTFGDGDRDHMDMRNVLSHELGHVMGLDHTCVARPGAAPVDSNGSPVPSCYPLSGLSPLITSSTMFNFAQPGEISKRAPGPDETRAICELYAERPPICSAPDLPGCGCQLDRDGASGLVPGVLVLGVAFLAWPRRRSR